MTVLENSADAKLDAAGQTTTSSFQKSGVYIFVIAFACVFYIANAAQILSHLDIGWHLAAGDLIRERGSVPFQDPWSFTLGDRQWFNASWLWDVTASIVYQHAGLSGLLLLAVACGAIIAGYITAICLRVGASTISVCIAAVAACMLFPHYATPPNVYLAAAPNMATMLFAVIFYGECLRRSRCLLLPVAMLPWVNMHGGFVLGFLILGVFGGVALLRRDWTGFRLYTITAIGCFLAIFVNPLGWHIYYGVVTTVGHFIQAYITEWMPYFTTTTLPGGIPVIVYISIFVALELRSGLTTPVRLEVRALAWLFLLLGFYQFRYMSLFVIFAAPVLALHIDRLLPRQLDRIKVQKAVFGAGIAAICALPIAFAYVKPSLAFPQLLSEQDARYLQAHFPKARLLNHWNTGGMLIFYTRGDVRVFVDGRAATAYPDDLLRDYFKLVEVDIDEAAWDGVFKKYQIDAVVWPKAHEELRRFLVDKRGWKEEYAGRYESVYRKP